MGGTCSSHGRNAYRMLTGKTDGKIPLGRPGHRWEENMRMNLRETEWEDMVWMNLVQDSNQWRALVNIVRKLRFPQKMGNFLTS